VFAAVRHQRRGLNMRRAGDSGQGRLNPLA